MPSKKSAPKKSAKQEALDLTALRERVASTVKSTLGYAATASDLEDRLAKPRWCIPTRIRLLDFALGGGLFEGRILRLYGAPGTGKTSLLDHCILACMQEGAVCARPDPEGSFDHRRLHQLASGPGLKVREDLLIPNEPLTLEDLFRSVHSIMHAVNPVKENYGSRPEVDYKLGFFVDTTSAAPSAAEHLDTLEAVKKVEKSSAFREGMDRARFLRASMRKLSLQLPLHGATMVTLEQASAKIGDAYTGGLTTTGGYGVSFQCSQSALVTSLAPFQHRRTGAETGIVVRVKTDKVRFAKPKATVSLPFYYERGFNDLESIVLLLEDAKVIEKDVRKKIVLPHPSGTEVSFHKACVQDFEAPQEVAEALYAQADKYKELLWVKKWKKSTLDDIDTADVGDGVEEEASAAG